ncbi:hypothetical protein AJ80_08269 [Polytolypa hystricis UAMH7299]|uniref:cutinase n=1 Tax=Polytolypa hystricis (strain UAMH7299) TaxID=1447883 RepID=A0A2B7XAM8_POLH7|nr:hypothetical protein AJ80_08269 [Polytolypa hystricis UAMH7299]
MKLESLVTLAVCAAAAVASPVSTSLHSSDLKSSRSVNPFTRLSKWFKRQGAITENGVLQNAGCQPLTLIFARGTNEPGNMGDDVGPPLATQLRSILSNRVTVQGLAYPASTLGNLLLGRDGAGDLVDLVYQAKTQCPSSKIALSGFSQGAMVVHRALEDLSSGDVAAVLLYGDPLRFDTLENIASSKVRNICAPGDPICQGGFDLDAHGTYGTYAREAAQFIVSATGVS